MICKRPRQCGWVRPRCRQEFPRDSAGRPRTHMMRWFRFGCRTDSETSPCCPPYSGLHTQQYNLSHIHTYIHTVFVNEINTIFLCNIIIQTLTFTLKLTSTRMRNKRIHTYIFKVLSKTCSLPNTSKYIYIHTYIFKWINHKKRARNINKCTYKHTCIQRYIHTYIHTEIQRYRDTYRDTCIHTLLNGPLWFSARPCLCQRVWRACHLLHSLPLCHPVESPHPANSKERTTDIQMYVCIYVCMYVCMYVLKR